MKDNYIKATLESLEAGLTPDRVIKGLKKTLQDKGHSQLLASVLRGVDRILSAQKTNLVKVVTATKEDQEKLQAEIKNALKQLDAGTDSISHAIDDTLIGGFVVEASGRRLDQSYKASLVKLYRSLTN